MQINENQHKTMNKIIIIDDTSSEQKEVRQIPGLNIVFQGGGEHSRSFISYEISRLCNDNAFELSR